MKYSFSIDSSSNTPIQEVQAELARSSRVTSPKPDSEKSHVFQILVVVLFLGLLWMTNVRDTAALTIDFGTYERTFEGTVVSGMTVLDALNASVIAGKIRFSFLIDERGYAKVVEFNDHTSFAQKTPLFFVNGKAISSFEVHKVSIQPEDQIMVRLPSN